LTACFTGHVERGSNRQGRIAARFQ
jgi:hypothetical protein